jgi:hypothetical protein
MHTFPLRTRLQNWKSSIIYCITVIVITVFYAIRYSSRDAGTSEPLIQAKLDQKQLYVRNDCNNSIFKWIQELEQKSVLLKQQMIAESSNEQNYLKRYRENSLFDPFEPHWNCPFERRVGNVFGDGGKFVCGQNKIFSSSRSCLVYSIGSYGEFSFEIEFKRIYGQFCEIHTFDPTGDAEKFAHQASASNIEFHPWGLSSSDKGNTMTLSGFMRRLNHSGRRIDLLKVDCEGCEYESFNSIFSEIKNNRIDVGQIQVELHLPEDKFKIPNFFKAAVESGFDIFHKERNQWGCSGWQCVEFSLIHANTKTRVLNTLLGI